MTQKKKTLFSIIIPSLNESVCLPVQLQSFASQTFRNFEVIVVDAKSEDHTAQIARTYSKSVPSLKVISSDKRNISHQRNLGARSASGKYLIFSDADNQFNSDFFKALSQRLQVSPSEYFTCSFKPDTKNITSWLFCLVWNIRLAAKSLSSHPLAVGAFIGCTPQSFHKIGGFREEIKYGEDKRFGEDAHKHSYSLRIFSHPRYTISLRRVRKNGVLKTIANYLLLNKRYRTQKYIDQEKEYPMGGSGHHT